MTHPQALLISLPRFSHLAIITQKDLFTDFAMKGEVRTDMNHFVSLFHQECHHEWKAIYRHVSVRLPQYLLTLVHFVV